MYLKFVFMNASQGTACKQVNRVGNSQTGCFSALAAPGRCRHQPDQKQVRGVRLPHRPALLHLLSRLLRCPSTLSACAEQGPQPPAQPTVAQLLRCISTRDARHGLGTCSPGCLRAPLQGLGSELLLATLAQDQMVPKLSLHWGSSHLAHLHRGVELCKTLVVDGDCAAGQQGGHEQLLGASCPALLTAEARHPTSKQGRTHTQPGSREARTVRATSSASAEDELQVVPTTHEQLLGDPCLPRHLPLQRVQGTGAGWSPNAGQSPN